MHTGSFDEDNDDDFIVLRSQEGESTRNYSPTGIKVVPLMAGSMPGSSITRMARKSNDDGDDVSSVYASSANYSSSGTSSSIGISSSSDGSDAAANNIFRGPAVEGWEHTQDLLSRRLFMEKKLKKALAGCAEERKRLEKMANDIESIGERKQSADVERESFNTNSTQPTTGTGILSSHKSGRVQKDPQSSSHTSVNSSISSKTFTIKETTQKLAEEEDSKTNKMIDDKVRDLLDRCDKMQSEIDAKAETIRELREDKKSVVRRFTEARGHHRHMQRKYEQIYKKMCTTQSKEIFKMNATIAEKDRQIRERDEVIRQLLDANEKLEAALKAMTKVAEEALKAKKQVRQDLKKLKAKHLNDIEKLNHRHNKELEELKSNISKKVTDLNELELTKEQLAAKLQAKERELEREMARRKEISPSSYDLESARRLLLQGEKRNLAIKANLRKKKKRSDAAPHCLPPSPTREITVQNECNWLQAQISATVEKIVDLKLNIEGMETNANEVQKEVEFEKKSEKERLVNNGLANEQSDKENRGKQVTISRGGIIDVAKKFAFGWDDDKTSGRAPLASRN